MDLKYREHCTFPGSGWIEPIQDADCPLVAEETAVQFIAEYERLQSALRQVAQALAWQCFGESRSFGDDVPLLQPHEADALAKEMLTPNAELSGRRDSDGRA